MSEVKRFVCKPGVYDVKISGFRDVMQPNENGDWVLASDYEALEAERKQYEAIARDGADRVKELEQNKQFWDECQRIERDALREERDSMHVEYKRMLAY